MRRSRHKLQVSTFPFLAVLLGAMGALILLLLVMDRRSKIVARTRAFEAHAAEVAARRDARARAQDGRVQDEEAQRLEWERQRQNLHELLVAQERELARDRQDMAAKLDAAGQGLDKQSQAAKDLEKSLLDQRARLDAKGQLLAQMRAGIARSTQLGAAAQAEVNKLSRELAQLERALEEARTLKAQETETYSLVPYRGKLGESRRPIYVECNALGLVFHPDGRRFDSDLDIKTFREEVERRGIELVREKKRDDQRRPPIQKVNTAPYVLFLVRPDGLESYYGAMTALRGFDLDFGYELIDASWVLDFSKSVIIADQKTTQPSGPLKKPAPRQLGSGVGYASQGMAPGASGNPAGNGGAPPHGGQSGAGTVAGPFIGSRAGPIVQGGAGGGRPGTFSGTSFTPQGARMEGSPGSGLALNNSPLGDPTGLPSFPGGNRGGAQPTDMPARTTLSNTDAAGKGNASGSMSTQSKANGDNSVIGPVAGAVTQGGAGGPPFRGTTWSPQGAQREGPPGSAMVTNNGPSGDSTGIPSSPGGNSVGASQTNSPDRTAASNTNAAGAANGSGSVPAQGKASGDELEKHEVTWRGSSPSTAKGGNIPENRLAGVTGPGQTNGNGTGGDEPPSMNPLARLAPTLPLSESGPGPKKPAPAPTIGRLLANRDYIMTIECFSDVVALYPSGQTFAISLGQNQKAVDESLIKAVQQLIARRQATVRPGETPYRPMLRFQVHPDALRTYFHVYPLFENMRIPMTRENMES